MTSDRRSEAKVEAFLRNNPLREDATRYGDLADEIGKAIEALLSEERQGAFIGSHQVRAIKAIQDRIRSALIAPTKPAVEVVGAAYCEGWADAANAERNARDGFPHLDDAEEGWASSESLAALQAPATPDALPASKEAEAGVEQIAETIWQAEWKRAGNGGLRKIPWTEVAPDDQNRYRFVAREVAALSQNGDRK